MTRTAWDDINNSRDRGDGRGACVSSKVHRRPPSSTQPCTPLRRRSPRPPPSVGTGAHRVWGLATGSRHGRHRATGPQVTSSRPRAADGPGRRQRAGLVGGGVDQMRDGRGAGPHHHPCSTTQRPPYLEANSTRSFGKGAPVVGMPRSTPVVTLRPRSDLRPAAHSLEIRGDGRILAVSRSCLSTAPPGDSSIISIQPAMIKVNYR